jgi:4-aminobutyrate aminotransferase-like enzyme
MTIAKGMASGMPIGGSVATPEIANAVDPGDFFSTYGGNPVCSAVALENIKIIEEENLTQNADQIGKLFMEGLNDLTNRFDIIGDVRGKGLMIGIELVKDRSSKKPAADSTKKAVQLLQDKGVIIGLGGFYGNVLRLQPPLVITQEQASKVMGKLTDVLAVL